MSVVRRTVGRVSDLSGQVVIVTGASKGIGVGVAQAFVAAGARVVIAARDEQGLAAVAERLGGETLAVPTDVSDEDSVRALVDRTVSTFGRLDAAVNNAGGSHRPAPVADLPTEVFDDVLGANLRGVFLCMRHEIPAMLASGGGSIVNMTSTAGIHPVAGTAAYAASKAAVIGLTRTAALDYAARGVRVNAIAPGPILTEKIAALPDEMRKAAGERTPLRRLGQTAEIGAAAVWLCGPDAGFVTGTTLPIDGGLVAGMQTFAR
jgi:NAD(P)-dependent dehydrogenase (short-subunit alcohol dehydrogenase family)